MRDDSVVSLQAASNVGKDSRNNVLRVVLSYLLSLRVKTIIILWLLFSVMLIIFAMIVYFVFSKSFKQLESMQSTDSSWRLMRSIYDDFQNSIKVALPIAAWDLTLEVMSLDSASIETYLDENVDSQFMSDVGIDFAIMVYPNGSLAGYRAIDSQSEALDPIELPHVLSEFSPDHPLLNGTDRNEAVVGGWIQYEDKIILLTGAPIQSGELTGPTNGVMLIGRIQRAIHLEVYATKTQQCVTFMVLNNSTNPDLVSIKNRARNTDPIPVNLIDPIWENNSPFSISPMQAKTKHQDRVCWGEDDGEASLSESRIAAYTVMADIFGEAVLVWRSDIARDIHRLSVQSLGWTLGLLGVIGMIVSIAIIALVEWSIIFPTLRLTSDVKKIATSNNVAFRVRGRGRDELGKMSHQINNMMEALEKSHIELEKEKEKSEKLLLNMLPEVISNRLKESGAAQKQLQMQQDQDAENVPNDNMLIADTFPEVSVLFSDMVGFTVLSSNIESTQLVRILNIIFSAFDKLCKIHGVEKIKTIGDAFMAVAGAPVPAVDHADRAVRQAIGMFRSIRKINAKLNCNINIRIGINSGSVVAGVIGTTKYVYDIFGDTVNVASRMESHGVPGCIHISEMTFVRLQDNYAFEDRGTISVKGKTEPIRTYLLRPDQYMQLNKRAYSVSDRSLESTLSNKV